MVLMCTLGLSHAIVNAQKDYPRLAEAPPARAPRRVAAVSYEDPCPQMEEWISTSSRDPNAFGLIVEGDSMRPRLLEGDHLVLELNPIPRTRRLCAAKTRDGRVMVKRFYRTGPEGKTIRLVSDNPNYSPIELPEEQFE